LYLPVRVLSNASRLTPGTARRITPCHDHVDSTTEDDDDGGEIQPRDK
jgi:hypothetical protein